MKITTLSWLLHLKFISALAAPNPMNNSSVTPLDLYSGHFQSNRYENHTLTAKPVVEITPKITKVYVQHNDTREAEEMLQWFRNQLRSFIFESHFDTFRFEVMSKKLEADFHDIIALTQEAVQKNLQLQRQVLFIRKILSVMVFCADMLTKYEFVVKPEYYLLNCVAELNVRLFLMCNEYGNLDPEFVRNPSKAIRFWLDLNLYAFQFRSLEVSPYLRAVFEIQVTKVQDCIKDLLSQISVIVG